MRLIALISVGTAALPTFAHELPDNCIEKTLAIVVRDQTAQIEYSLGISDRTIAELVTTWQNENTAKTKVADADPGELKLFDEAKPGDPGTRSGHDLADEFRQLAFEKIAGQMRVVIDGKPVKLERVSVESSARHHFSLIAKYSFSIPEKESMKLSIDDQSFKNMDGSARYSLKAMGSALIIRSNVAPIIIRASRHELAELTLDQRALFSRIEATIGWVQQQQK